VFCEVKNIMKTLQMRLTWKQVAIFTAWMFFVGGLNAFEQGNILLGIIIASIVGVLSLGAIVVAETFL
jgi:hypothetical protein